MLIDIECEHETDQLTIHVNSYWMWTRNWSANRPCLKLLNVNTKLIS